MNRSARFSQKFWLLAGVSLSSGVLWLSSCEAPSDENSASNSVGNAASGANNLTSAPTPDATPKRGMSYVLFVPNGDGVLSRQVVRDTSTLVPLTYEQKSQRALELLWPKLDFFPSGTKLLSAPKKEKNGIVRLNFNKAFMQLDTAPENVMLLILDSISQSLGALENPNARPAKPVKFMIVVEGKKVGEFNQFSLAEPWQAAGLEEEIPSRPEDDPPATDNSGDKKTTDNKVTGNKTTGNKITGNKITGNKTSPTPNGGGY